MGDADLFAKLNRILETHNLSSDGNDDSDDFLERFTYDLGAGNDLANKGYVSMFKTAFCIVGL